MTLVTFTIALQVKERIVTEILCEQKFCLVNKPIIICVQLHIFACDLWIQRHFFHPPFFKLKHEKNIETSIESSRKPCDIVYKVVYGSPFH